MCSRVNVQNEQMKGKSQVNCCERKVEFAIHQKFAVEACVNLGEASVTLRRCFRSFASTTAQMLKGFVSHWLCAVSEDSNNITQ